MFVKREGSKIVSFYFGDLVLWMREINSEKLQKVIDSNDMDQIKNLMTYHIIGFQVKNNKGYIKDPVPAKKFFRQYEIAYDMGFLPSTEATYYLRPFGSLAFERIYGRDFLSKIESVLEQHHIDTVFAVETTQNNLVKIRLNQSEILMYTSNVNFSIARLLKEKTKAVLSVWDREYHFLHDILEWDKKLARKMTDYMVLGIKEKADVPMQIRYYQDIDAHTLFLSDKKNPVSRQLENSLNKNLEKFLEIQDFEYLGFKEFAALYDKLFGEVEMKYTVFQHPYEDVIMQEYHMLQQRDSEYVIF